MSISSIGSSYSAYTYQWQNQSLQGSTSNTTASSSTSNAYSYDGASTVSSMIELVQYAMDSMGVGGDERVTFNQVDKYKQEMESEFSAELNARIAATNVASDASFTVSLGADGKIWVDTTHADKQKIQNYFDTNPSIGSDLLKSLEDSGYDISGNVKFNVSSIGTISLVSSKNNTLQSAFEDNEVLGANLIKDLTEKEFNLENGIKLSYSEGVLSSSDEKLQAYLDEHPELASEVKAILEESEVSEDTSISLSIDDQGEISVNSSLDSDDMSLERFLIENAVGTDIKDGLKNQGIDKDIDFSLSVVDGRVVVNSSHPDAAFVQAILDADENLSKAYMQIDAIAGIEAARKSMQIDPSAMRKRIEMESMATWWASTGTSNIGTFSGGNFSTMSGVNSVV